MKRNIILIAILVAFILLITFLSMWGIRVTQSIMTLHAKAKTENSVTLCQYNASGNLVKEWISTDNAFYSQFFFWSVENEINKNSIEGGVVKKIPYGHCFKRNEY